MMTTLLGNKPSYASLCKKCGKCERHCPQHLEIRKEPEQVSKEMERPRFKVMRLGLVLFQKIKSRLGGGKKKNNT